MAADSESDVHFLVLIHGMWGNPIHLSELERMIKETKGGGTHAGSDGVKETLEVLVANSNMEEHTYDGIDWGAERITKEVCYLSYC